MAPAGKNGIVPPNPWGWVEKAVENNTVTPSQRQLLSAYRVSIYRECAYRKRTCKCRKNPHCLWGMGDHIWRTDDITKDEQSQIREEGEVAGLVNQGQTCYVNSLLQLWYHNPILRPAILRWEPLKVSDPTIASHSHTLAVTNGQDQKHNGLDNSENDGSVEETSMDAAERDYTQMCDVMGHLQMMFAKMKASKQKAIDTNAFVNALGLDPGQQQDAEEFSKLLLNCIITLLDKFPSSVNRKVSQAFKTCFTGQSQFTTRCDQCKTNAVGRVEEFNELQLPVTSTLHDSFNSYFTAEKLEGDNQYSCQVCNSKQDAVRAVRLMSLPKVLNIQLLRFVFDPTTYEKKKVMKHMTFPETLDMSQYVSQDSDTPTVNTTIQTQNHSYVLNAVLIHHGNKASSGHYTSHIRDPESREWIECNDDKVAKINTKSQNRSKKLVIRTEDAEGSEAPLASSSDVGSKGAYMLVYTREQYFFNPEAEPDLLPRLAEKIKEEDDKFEIEQLKQKEASDLESQKRATRRAEIDSLYATKYPPPEVEVGDSSPRSDTSVEVIGTKSAPDPPPPVDVNTIDFISTDWLEQWLCVKTLEDLPAITNENILCPHGKLRPPRKPDQNTLYKIIPSSVADALYERYGGASRLHGLAALCIDCVTTHYNYLKDLINLEKDVKTVADSVRSCDQQDFGMTELTEDYHAHKFLIGKESIKEWKKHAKKLLEHNERPDCSQVDVDWSMNHELKCTHDNLGINRAIRKRITSTGFNILSKYFPDGIWYVSGEAECSECLDRESTNAAVLEEYKNLATLEKQRLSDLYKGTPRPNSNSIGTFALLPASFIDSWRDFLRNPVTEPPNHISMIEIVCDGDPCGCDEPKLRYPFTSLQEHSGIEERDLLDKVAMVTLVEMNILMENTRTMDGQAPTVTIERDRVDSRKRIYRHNMGTCELSVQSWAAIVVEIKYTYDGSIIVRKVEDEDEIKLETNGHSFGGDAEEKPSKVPRIDNQSNGAIRRSTRRRPSRFDMRYDIHSSLTIRDFQIHNLVKGFKAGLSDQHLFFNGIELSEEERRKSFCQLMIPSGTILHLLIDKQGSNDDAKKAEEAKSRPPAVERGFSGTALLGSSFRPTKVFTGAATSSPGVVAETSTITCVTPVPPLSLCGEVKQAEVAQRLPPEEPMEVN